MRLRRVVISRLFPLPVSAPLETRIRMVFAVRRPTVLAPVVTVIRPVVVAAARAAGLSVDLIASAVRAAKARKPLRVTVPPQHLAIPPPELVAA